eukprot:TRINITY_DN1778_c0_g1_i4.p1 TRINITY_DN1778_c0_g1~~TRINITY_DN1778_c0_g1_i4.p1  ORF type:complete len:143 (+),score=31.13 TRINITY_DN1778_c0_g1_i4:193-621(+)
MYFNGQYHLFYQMNPSKTAVWGDMHWGHAVSTNMLDWTHLGIALAPTPNGYDKDGVFSGSVTLQNVFVPPHLRDAVNGSDNPLIPTILYTGVQPEVQCMAFPADLNDPDLKEWVKFDGNPIVNKPPFPLLGFRDPTTAWSPL